MDKGHEIKVLDHGYVRLVDWMGDDLAPLSAARMSTGNPTGVDEVKDDATRDYLWRHQHSTPFEMAVLQVEVQCPIFVAREWMRHRSASYNEYSQRYSEALDLYYLPEPERVQGQDAHNKQGSGGEIADSALKTFISLTREEQHQQRDNYEWSLRQGVARELARINMPVSNYTRFRTQTNLRNWMHFLKLRMADNAQYEIRVYAEAVAEMIKALWPKTWEVFEEHTLKAVTLSKTEKEIIAGFFEAHLPTWLKTEAERRGLSKSRQREFFAKLGIERVTV